MARQTQLSGRPKLDSAEKRAPERLDVRRWDHGFRRGESFRTSFATALLLAVFALVGCQRRSVTGPSGIVAPAPASQFMEGQPDLTISNASFSPGSRSSEDVITFQVSVRNVGLARAGASTLRLAIEGLPDPLEVSVPALGPDEEYRYEHDVAFNASSTYVATVTADALGQQLETDETNNMLIKSFAVAQ